jgi:hypothetical protein
MYLGEPVNESGSMSLCPTEQASVSPDSTASYNPFNSSHQIVCWLFLMKDNL